MTVRASGVDASAIATVGDARRLARAWTPTALLLLGLSAVVLARWAGTRSGLDPIGLGAAFGLALLALAMARPGIRSRPGAVARPIAWVRPGRPRVRSLAMGVGAGMALVALTSLGAVLGGVDLPAGLGRPAAPFLPWAAVTTLVATGEEALLRGRLFDVTRHAGGTVAALVLTTVAFALLHVPLYGWHVVPLDLAVGVLFAGLRLVTRGYAAPAAAHAVADLATWWL